MTNPNMPSVTELTPAPLVETGFSVGNMLRNKLTIATLAAVGVASLVGGVAKAGGKEDSKAKIGAKISAVNNSFENSDSLFSPLIRITEQATELQGPQVQFFNVVALDNPQNTVNPKIIDFIGGLQFYSRERGKGLRVRIAQANGQYDAPLIRIGMTQSEIIADNKNNNALKVIKTVTDRISELKFPTTERINIGLIERNTGGCFLLPIGAANPGNLEIINISATDVTCPTSNSPNGFSALNVVASQGIIWIPRTGNFVKDPQDTMSDLSLINSRSWAWANTWFNHSGTYGDALHNSPYYQHPLAITEAGSGKGDVLQSPQPDKCYLDCGTGLLYPAGTLVTLKAEAEAGSKFGGFKNCPQPEGDVCKVPMTQEQSVSAVFDKKIVTPPPPKTSILVARVIKSRKLGSKIEKFDGNGTIVFASKEGKTRTYTTNKIGQLVMLRLKPAEGSFISYVEGCDKPPAHRGNPINTKRCYVYMRTVDNPSTPKKEVETVEVGYKKTKPKPEK